MECRFISKGKTAFKIHVPKPEGGVVHRSVGFIRKGKNKAKREAIKLRNDLGRQLWKKFWPRVLRDKSLLLRVKHLTTQPMFVSIPRKRNKYGHVINYHDVYRVNWMDENGVKRYAIRSIRRHGKTAAYLITKRILFDGIHRYLDLLLFMEIITRADLRQVNTYLKDIKQ